MPVYLDAADMNVTLGDLVLETSTTEGTGAYALDGAPAGYQTFVNGVGNGQPTVYRASGGSAWEMVVGVVTAGSPNTLTRATTLLSSNSNLPINWPPGDKVLRCVAPASLLMQIVDPARVADLETSIAVLSGYLHGLETSQAADTDHDITIAVGAARDSTNVATLTRTSAITKRIDATWAVGTNQGGLDTGTVANSTWYAIWLIRRSDTGVVDALFSTSGTVPTMPAGYNQRRRIAWVRTDGSANILAYFQRGDRFQWAVPVEITTVPPSSATGGTTINPRVPPQIGAVMISLTIGESSDGEIGRVWLFDPAVNDAGIDPATALRSLSVKQVSGSGIAVASGQFVIGTNSSGQIKAKSGSGNSTPSDFILHTEGWIDRRGRDS